MEYKKNQEDRMDNNNNCREVVAAVDPGICRFNTFVTARIEKGVVRIVLRSECPSVQELGRHLNTIEPFEALSMPYSRNPVYLISGNFLKHSACPVPVAILKSIEIVSGLALKRDVIIRFEGC